MRHCRKNVQNFQSGTILHEVVLGPFWASGVSFEVWCRENDVNPAAARSALKGYSSGNQGQTVIRKLVKGAGDEVVAVVYRTGIERHAAEEALKGLSDKEKANSAGPVDENHRPRRSRGAALCGQPTHRAFQHPDAGSV